MGLDMYLYAVKEDYHSHYTDPIDPDEIPDHIHALATKTDISVTNKTSYKIGYWRKANAVHKFFIDNCADGVDDCRSVYVSIETIKELKDKCNKILVAQLTKDKEHFEKIAEEELPCKSGFFFGSTEYGDWYVDDIRYTAELCDSVLEWYENLESHGENPDDWSIEYCASW